MQRVWKTRSIPLAGTLYKRTYNLKSKAECFNSATSCIILKNWAFNFTLRVKMIWLVQNYINHEKNNKGKKWNKEKCKGPMKSWLACAHGLKY